MISVTDLSSYLYCPRKLYFAKVLHISEAPKSVLVKGSIRHLAHDLSVKSERTIVSSLGEIDRDVFVSCFSERYGFFLRDAITSYLKQLDSFGLDPSEVFDDFWSNFDAESRIRALQVFEFAERSNLSGSALWDALVPKLESELRISSSALQLRGVIDRLEIFEDFVVPVELKTGSSPKEGVWPSHLVQVGAYLLLLKESGRRVREAHIHYIDSNERRIVVLNPFLEEHILGLISQVNGLLSSVAVPPVCDNTNKCKNCGIRNNCFPAER